MDREYDRLITEELRELRQIDFSSKQGLTSAKTVLDREIDEVGTPERDDFDAKARARHYGEILRQRRRELAYDYCKKLQSKWPDSPTGNLRHSVGFLERDGHFYIMVGMELVVKI